MLKYLFAAMLVFTFGPTAYADICGRTNEIVVAIEKETGKNCRDISAAELSKIPYLYFNTRTMTALKADDFNGLSNLKKLVIIENNLSNLPVGVFDGLPLENLDIQSTQLTSLDKDLFHGLNKLQVLALSANSKLKTLPEGLFSGLTSLENLSLGEHDFLPVNIFDPLTNLKNLYLTLNKIDEHQFSKLTSLQGLSVFGNGVAHAPANLIKGLPLTSIRISYVASLDENVLAGAENLVEIDLEKNKLKTLPPRLFQDHKNLKIVYLSFNPFQYISSKNFDGSPNLKQVFMRFNYLTGFQENLLRNEYPEIQFYFNW